MASNKDDSRNSDSRPQPFIIDLNETPSSPSSDAPPSPASTAYLAVRNFLGPPRPASGAAAELPTESWSGPCPCKRADAKGATIICDGCDRWFHLGCAGLRLRQAVILEDWVCGGCREKGHGSKRWPLGSGSNGTGVRLLDINSLPPSDGEGETSDEWLSQRIHSADEKSLTSDAISASSSHSNLWNTRNGFDVLGGSGSTNHLVRSSFEGGIHNRLNSNRSSEEADLSSNCRGRFRSTRSNSSIRRKEPARFSRVQRPTVNHILRSDSGGVLPSDMEIVEPGTCNTGTNATLAEARAEGNCGSESQQLNDGFPVQCEDFFILHLGEVDMRASYHISTQIWPVGYQASWHDKITGSIFTCYVLDGGNSGPIFKVKRCPCSTSLIPNGSTIISKGILVQSDAKNATQVDASITSDIVSDEDDIVQMYLSAPDPIGQDLSSFLGSGINESGDVQRVDALPPQSNGAPEKSATLLPENAAFTDGVGEFSVEGQSSSLVWTKVSETLVNACRELYKQTGIIHFYCKHELGGMPSDSADAKTEDIFAPLRKFCSSSGATNFPLVISSVNEIDTSCEALEKWLNQDRFGLDLDFVQEIIERLPGGHACSGYEFLSKKKDYSTSLNLGSGLLMIKRKNGVCVDNNTVLDDLLKGCKSLRHQDAGQSPGIEARHPPPRGRPLSSKLPAELSGDIVQVWEFLWRFGEILGMNHPLTLEELEKELTDPWFDELNFLEKIEKEIHENRFRSSFGGDDMIGNILSPQCGSDSAIPTENAPRFVKVETLAEKEASRASRTYHRCTGEALTKAHSSLLKVLVGELQAKVAAFVDPTFDTGESKSRRGRKRDIDNSVPVKKSKIELLPFNELTWPELARRYILAVLTMDSNLDSSEITSREGGKVFRCLQGDGGVLCGSLTGVAGMEADALLLAEATKQVCRSLKIENDVWPVEVKDPDAVSACETTGVSGSKVPEWALVLEPVRKLPTNVGTRIRKCVYEALDKEPPEWARKILQHSISKEVYKGNASGPTKKAVLSVLADVYGEGRHQKSDKGRKGKSTNTMSGIILKQCRFVLRRAAAADEAKTFCNLLGTIYWNPNDNDDEGILGSPAMVSRPLDFRTVDLRLAAGAYGGSHEAFLEDVREVWHNVRTAYGDQPELLQLAETLSQNFESLYEKEVLTLVQKYREHFNLECSNSGPKKELIDIVAYANDVPKAPWDEGVCKVCGIDKDDESVLLCDTCDSEYHTYCLVPPLARIPEGNWYCPSCVSGQGKAKDASTCTRVLNRRRQKRYHGEGSRVLSETLNHLAVTMGEKEYWEFTVEERVFLLKFLCDEVLNSTIIREHLDQCAEMTSDLQQKLRSLTGELKNLKCKEEVLSARAVKESTIIFDGAGEAARDRIPTVFTNHGRWTGQRQTLSNKYTNHTASTDMLNLEDVLEENKRPYEFCSKVIAEKISNGSRTDVKVADTGNQIRDVHYVTDSGLLLETSFSQKTSTADEPNGQIRQALLTEQKSVEEMGGEPHIHCNVNRELAFGMETNGSVLPPELQDFCTGQTHLSEHIAVRPTNFDNIFPCHYSKIQIESNGPQAHNLEESSLKNEILLLEDSITSIELQLLMISMRRKFLGRDSFGRLYWVLSRPGIRPWVVVDGSIPLQPQSTDAECRDLYTDSLPSKSSNCSMPRGSTASCGKDLHGLSHGVKNFASCVYYGSDSEIWELVEWLSDTDQWERELKESILHVHRLRSIGQARCQVRDDSQGDASKPVVSEMTLAPNSLVTRAANILQTKYGPCLESETIDIPKKRGRKAKVIHEDRMYRCECLEPIWPSRQHCLSCHQSFCTNAELEGHNDGKCNSSPVASDDCKVNDEPSRGKRLKRTEANHEGYIDEVFKGEKFDVSSRLIKFQKKEMVCPYTFEEISKKFITKDSNKELVKEIGLLGSNGIPMLIPSTCSYIDDPALILDPTRKDKVKVVVHPTPESNGVESSLNSNHTSSYSRKRNGGSGTMEALETEVTKSDCVETKDSLSSLNDTSLDLDAGNCEIVPDSSLRPLLGRDSELLRRLKINLLDIDAALPEEALRPTKAHSSKRCAWRAFVKSADSILEMVKAAIVFEDMIKTKYLRNGWWYWSSLSAAARTSTLSSLALRIYTLDASIVYENDLPGWDGNDPMDISKSVTKRKEVEG